MAHRPDSLVIRGRVEEATTNARKKAFLACLKRVATVSIACELTGVNRKTVYEWRKEDEQFAEDWDNAIIHAFEGLESATYLKLAKMLQTEHQRIAMPEARLIELFLAGAKPEKYRQRTVEVEVNQFGFSIDWSSVPDAVVAAFNRGELTLNDVYQATLLQQQQASENEKRDDNDGNGTLSGM